MKKLLISIFAFVLLILCLFSCNTNTSEEIYIIKYGNPADRDTNEEVHVQYYAGYNIILFDSIPDIFYHRIRSWPHHHWYGDAYGFVPDFFFLRPLYFEKDTNLDKIKEVVLAEVLERAHPWVYLIYNQDTIRDKRFFALKDFFESNNIHVSVRKPTEEENYILISILSGKEYEPHLIEWKNTVNVSDKSWLFEERKWYSIHSE